MVSRKQKHYICPKCNVALDETSTRRKGRAVRLRGEGHQVVGEQSTRSAVATGIGFSLFASLMAGLATKIAGPGLWVVVIIWGYAVIEGLIKGWRYSKMAEPGRGLAKAFFVGAAAMVATAAALFVIALVLKLSASL